MEFDDIPKVELHLHLDCCLRFEVARAVNSRLTPDDFKTELATFEARGLPEALVRIRRGLTLLQTEQALRLLVDDVVAQLLADRVIYAELRFAPLLHTKGDLDAAQVVEVVSDQLARAATASSLEARLILCTLRSFNAEQSLQTAQLAAAYRHRGVVAIDLAGDEAGYPIDPHVAAFRHAAEQGLFRTAHAGEGAGPESVFETLRLLAPHRIGHGVRAAEDPALLQTIVGRGIHLEVCPACNVQIGLYPTLADHPVATLAAAGAQVGINSDGRTLIGQTLSEQYRKLGQTFGWTAEELIRCNRAALEAAFLPEDEKERLRRLLAPP